MALVLAHISDLHVSRYGEHVSSLKAQFRHKRGEEGAEWMTLQTTDGWRIQQRVVKKSRWSSREVPGALRLLDEAGYVQIRRKTELGTEGAVLKELESLIEERRSTAHDRLTAAFPTLKATLGMLELDPTNTNLLFCKVAHRLRELEPDWVLVTGDLTDDGIGYDLVLRGLQPWADMGRLLAIPGNHDVYSSPPFVVPSHERKGVREKRALWAEFAKALELPAEGHWLRELGEGAVLCGLDSCTPAWTPLSASGEVPVASFAAIEDELSQLEGTCRLAMLHHHVVNPPIQHIGRTPWQLGMRLRNAKEVYAQLVRLGFACVLNGHRHVGYRYHPAHAPLFVSAPSTTLGCRTGAKPYLWRVSISGGEVQSVKERAL